MSFAASVGGLNSIALTFLPLYFTSLGGSVLQYGTVTAFGMLVAIVSTIVGGTIVPRHGLKRILIISFWFGPAILLGYYFSKDYFALSLVLILSALGSISSPNARQLVADSTVMRKRATQLS